jgi:hypothetical protein
MNNIMRKMAHTVVVVGALVGLGNIYGLQSANIAFARGLFGAVCASQCVAPAVNCPTGCNENVYHPCNSSTHTCDPTTGGASICQGPATCKQVDHTGYDCD